jgi:hypothetical protein
MEPSRRGSEAKRKIGRDAWCVRVYRLGEEPPGDDLSASTTPAQRLALVTQLSRRMWALSGRAVPSYVRAEMPVRILRSS